MLTLEEQIAAWGGPAYVQEDAAANKNWFWTVIERLLQLTAVNTVSEHAEKRRPVRAVLIGSPLQNAHATTCRGPDGELVDLIGLHVGLVQAIRNVLDPLVDLVGVLEELKSPRPPIDVGPARDFAVVALTGLTVLFVLAHESRHLLNGHVDFVACNFGVSVLSESDVLGDSGFHLTRYALEYDADCNAAKVLALLAKKWQTSLSPMEIPHQRQLFSSDRLMAYHIGFALYAFFQMSFADPATPVGGILHPASHVRLRWSLGTIFAMEARELLPKGFAKSAWDGALKAAQAIAFDRQQPLPAQHIEAAFQQGSYESPLVEAIRAEWTRIRPQLMPLARGGNLAPADPPLSAPSPE